MSTNAETVIALDRNRMRAMEAKDYAFLEAVLADNLVYVHSSGKVQTKPSLLSNMRAGATVYATLEPTDVHAQDLGAFVILTGRARADGVANGDALSFTVRFISAYAHRDGHWQMVTWQSTRIL